LHHFDLTSETLYSNPLDKSADQFFCDPCHLAAALELPAAKWHVEFYIDLPKADNLLSIA